MKKTEKRILAGGLAFILLSVSAAGGFASMRKHDTVQDAVTVKTVAKYDFSAIKAGDYIEAVDDYKNPELFDLDKTVVRDSDAEADLNDYLLEYPVYEKILDREIVSGDMVSVSYSISTQPAGETAAGEAVLLIGDGGFPRDVEENLTGHRPGEAVSLETVIPEDYEGIFRNDSGEEISLSGMSAVFDISISHICGNEKTADELTDEDIRELTAGDYGTKAEFMEYIKTSLVERNESDLLKGVWDTLISGCVIRADREADFNRLAESETEYEMDYYTALASGYGYDMDTFAIENGYDSLAAFETRVRSDSERLVKEYLITYYIADAENLRLNETDYETAAAGLLDVYGARDMAELEDTYGATEILLYLQMQRVNDWLMETLGIRK